MSLPTDNIDRSLEALYTYASTILKGELNASTIMLLMNQLIIFVEQYKTYTGEQKKYLVITTLNKIINEKINNSNDRDQLLELCKVLLPTIIDTVVSALNGEITFTNEHVKGCFNSLLLCFCKKKTASV